MTGQLTTVPNVAQDAPYLKGYGAFLQKIVALLKIECLELVAPILCRKGSTKRAAAHQVRRAP